MQASGEKFDVTRDLTRYVVSLKGLGLQKLGSSLSKRDSHSIQIDLKREYPYPGGIEVVWLTPIFHPNIRPEDGKVCIQLLNEWSETQTIASVVRALKQLLVEPNPNNALNKEAADYFAEHPNALESIAVPSLESKKPRIIRVT